MLDIPTNSSQQVDTFDSSSHPMFRSVATTVNFNKLRKRLLREVREAIDTYQMTKPGGRWMVCLSGGKDSYTLLALLLDLKWRGLLEADLLICWLAILTRHSQDFRQTCCRIFLRKSVLST